MTPSPARALLDRVARSTEVSVDILGRIEGTAANPPVVQVCIRQPAARGVLYRSGVLTRELLEIIADDVRHLGPGARLEIASLRTLSRIDSPSGGGGPALGADASPGRGRRGP